MPVSFSSISFQSAALRRRPDTAIQFGWSAKDKPDYALTLEPADWQNQKKMIPTAAWIDRAARKLVGESEETPRFFVLPNITDYTRDPEKIHDFQARLVAMLSDRLQEIAPDFFTFQSEEDRRYVEDNGWIISTQGLDGHVKYDGRKSGHGGGGVYTPLHSDGQGCPLLCLSYGPYKNVKGGTPTLADMRQMGKDEAFDPKEALEVWHPDTDIYRTARSRYTVTPSPRYFDPVNRIPIVVFNNYNLCKADEPESVGVFHGATRVTRRDANNPEYARPLYKAALINTDTKHWGENGHETIRVVPHGGQ